MSVALCAHRFPDGTFCKRRALEESRFCNYHREQAVRVKFPEHKIPDFEEHSDVHPLGRLADPRDIFNVARETLNAARHGRIPPGQVYAVACAMNMWFTAYDRLQYAERQQALDTQYVAKVLETEQEAAATRAAAPLPLPVKIDQPAAVEQVAATLRSTQNLKPVTDYPGYAERSGGASPAPTRTGEGAASNAPTNEARTAAPRQNGSRRAGAKRPQDVPARVAESLTRKLLEQAFRPIRANGKDKRSPPG